MTSTATKKPATTKTAAKKPAEKPAASASKATGTLTEAALLKMSEKDYMNKEQLAFFKERLEALRDDILKNANTRRSILCL